MLCTRGVDRNPRCTPEQAAELRAFLDSLDHDATDQKWQRDFSSFKDWCLQQTVPRAPLRTGLGAEKQFAEWLHHAKTRSRSDHIDELQRFLYELTPSWSRVFSQYKEWCLSQRPHRKPHHSATFGLEKRMYTWQFIFCSPQHRLM